MMELQVHVRPKNGQEFRMLYTAAFRTNTYMEDPVDTTFWDIFYRATINNRLVCFRSQKNM